MKTISFIQDPSPRKALSRWTGALALAIFLTIFSPQPARGTPLEAQLPKTLEETQLLLVEISWDFGDVAPPDWRKELTTSDPTASFDLRWIHLGPGFSSAVLAVESADGAPLGEVPLPLTPVFSDGYRYTSVTVGDLPGAPTLALRVVLKNAVGAPIGQPSNAVQISAASPPDPFLYTPFFIKTIQSDIGVPGLAGSIWCQGSQREETWVAGVRRFDRGWQIAGSDLWYIGSNTKAFTCTLLGVMIQNGTQLAPGAVGGPMLHWDTPVAHVFPEWEEWIQPRFYSTTLRHLACHRSGLRMFVGDFDETEYMGPGSRNEDPVTFRREMTFALLARDHFDIIPPVPPSFVPTTETTTPGGKWHYGHGNYIVLAAVIEKLTGQPYETALRNMVLNPLFITTARFGLPVNASPYQPHGHYRAAEFPHAIIRDNRAVRPVWNAAGGLTLSQSDWLRFCRLHLNGSEGLLTLQPATLGELHTPHPREDPSTSPSKADPSYGWGWGIRAEAGGLELSHNGSNGRFYSRHTVHTGHGFAVVTATNIGPKKEGNGEIAVGQLHGHLIEKNIAKVTLGRTVAGASGGRSGGSKGILSLPAHEEGMHFDVWLMPEFLLGGGFLHVSLGAHDVFHRSLAFEARRPRALGFGLVDDDYVRLRFSSERDILYDVFRSPDLSPRGWELLQRVTGGEGETEIQLRYRPELSREFFQVREVEN